MSSYIWPPKGSGGSGSGTVTSVSVVSANGLAGTVANATTTPALTLSTSITGLLQGDGTALSPYVGGSLVEATSSVLTIGNGANSQIGTGTTLTVKQASTSQSGYLSNTDWNTFNGKQASGSYITALTGGVTASGPGSSVATVVTNANLTGDVTSVGNATTLATVNSNVGSFGSSTSIPSLIVNAKGLVTAASGNVVIAPAGTLSGTTLNSTVVTSSLTSVGTQSAALNMGSHKINLVTDPTSAQDAATKNYVDNALAGINPAVAVQVATTSAGNTSALTYNNGVSGIGATLTGVANTALVIDGYTFTAINQRLLVKNDTQSPSGSFNGVYYVTQIQTAILPIILTRALDYDQPSDINNTGAIPVINGTVNGTTQWVLTSLINTVGTDPLTFSQFARNPADYLLKANNLSDVAVKATSFNNLSPMTTGGDLIYGGASGAGTRLANGSAGTVLTSNGTTLAPSWTTFSFTTPNSTVLVDTDSGKGSTNTGVRIYTNSSTTGSDITYATSATLGDTFTINTTGIYSMIMQDALTAGFAMGITRNATLLTTDPNSITDGTEIIGPTNNPWSLSGTIHLTAGDIIRVQANSGAISNGGVISYFRITRVS